MLANAIALAKRDVYVFGLRPQIGITFWVASGTASLPLPHQPVQYFAAEFAVIEFYQIKPTFCFLTRFRRDLHHHLYQGTIPAARIVSGQPVSQLPEHDIGRYNFEDLWRQNQRTDRTWPSLSVFRLSCSAISTLLSLVVA